MDNPQGAQKAQKWLDANYLKGMSFDTIKYDEQEHIWHELTMLTGSMDDAQELIKKHFREGKEVKLNGKILLEQAGVVKEDTQVVTSLGRVGIPDRALKDAKTNGYGLVEVRPDYINVVVNPAKFPGDYSEGSMIENDQLYWKLYDKLRLRVYKPTFSVETAAKIGNLVYLELDIESSE